MKCRTVQIEIGSGSELRQAAHDHLDVCDECRRFAAGLDELRLLSRSNLATPPGLRERTLDHCQRMLAEKTILPGPTYGQRLRRLFDSPGFIAAFATSSVIILVGLTAMQVDSLQDKTASNLFKIIFVQLAVQNLAAALFLPALMFIKHKLGGRFLSTTEIGV
jgi:hypothetical protein